MTSILNFDYFVCEIDHIHHILLVEDNGFFDTDYDCGWFKAIPTNDDPVHALPLEKASVSRTRNLCTYWPSLSLCLVSLLLRSGLQSFLQG